MGMDNTQNGKDNSEDTSSDLTSESTDADPQDSKTPPTDPESDSIDLAETLSDETPDDDARSTLLEADDREAEAALAAALAATPLLSDGSEADADAPTDTAEAEPELHEEEHHEEEHSRSFASRVLTWLILLLAGGGIALWGAPRIAPELPDGLGPVKAWLMPGEMQSRGQIAELEARVNDQLANVSGGLPEDDVAALVDARLAALQGDVDSRLQSLADQLAATDGASIEGRVAQIEARLEGLVASVDGLNVGAEGLSADDQAALGTFGATVEGLRAELAALADQQGALSQRIDDVEVAVDRRLTEAEQEVAAVNEEAEATKSSALASAAVSLINAAIASGEPFGDALAQLQANTDAPPAEALTAVSETGVAPLGTLRSGFSDAAHNAIRADIKADGQENPGTRLAAFLEAQIATRSLTPQEGDSTDAVLSRAEDALRRDNLAAAVQELQALPDTARAAMGSWLERAEARVAAREALAELQATLN